MKIIKTKIKSLVGKEEALIIAYRNGDSISKIADDFGSTRRSVSKVLKDNNVSKNKSKIDIIREHKDKIIQDYLNGNSITDIAKQNGWERHNVDQLIIESGIDKRSAKEVVDVDTYTRGPKKLQTEEDIQKCIEFYELGSTFTEIGELFDCSAVTIRNKLMKAGVKLRTAKENAGTAKKKRVVTMLEKYGVENPMQDPEILHKSFIKAHRYKNYELDGVLFENLQGYEPQAVFDIHKNEILGEPIKLKEIIVDSKIIPTLYYTWNDSNRKYFPDMYIPKLNMLVEVKSEYTYNQHKERNDLKIDAMYRSEYNFVVMIYNDKTSDGIKGVYINKKPIEFNL